MKVNEIKVDKFLATSHTYFIETNLDSAGTFDWIKQALTIFGLEDELLIKYAE